MTAYLDFSDLEKTLMDLLNEAKKPPPWSLTITRIDNGYTLIGHDINCVVEDDDEDELISHEQLLWYIMEYFNFGGSKHDSERIRIVREKQ